jgi:cysteine-rich repeat protein
MRLAGGSMPQLFPGQADGETVWSSLVHFSGDELAASRVITWRPGCGNGDLDEGELFDNGQPWEPSTEYHTTCGATCGDGFVHEGEGCDDGNNDDNDGCSRLCQVE